MIRCLCRFHVECAVHDGDGKRWDAYTVDDVARLARVTFEPAKEDWSCYCGRHEATDNELPVGTPCIWERASYEYNEWDCRCAEDYRDQWLSGQTIDWDAVQLFHRQDRRWQIKRRIARFLLPLRELVWRFRAWQARPR